MTKRLRVLLGLLAGLLVLSAGVWLFWPHTAITRENAKKIKEGMTLAEVEAILGGPERDETDGMAVCWQNGADYIVFNADPVLNSGGWKSDECSISISFAASGVCSILFGTVERDELAKRPTVIERMRRRLRL